MQNGWQCRGYADVCDWDTEEVRTVLTDILSVSLATESASKEGVELKGGVWEDPTEEDIQVPRTDLETQCADVMVEYVDMMRGREE